MSGAAERVKVALYHALGPAIAEALQDPGTEEIRANPDGRIWVVHNRRGTYDSGKTINAVDANAVIRMMADAAGIIVTASNPLVAGDLPGGGERFQGVFPPVATAPFFVIRKPSPTTYTLDDYVSMGSATPEQIATIRRLISRPNPRNILLIGGTFSGKTTFGKAMLAEPAYINDRCAILEDRRELEFEGVDVTPMLAIEGSITMADLVKATLRLSPRRIVVGEVRDAAAWALIQSWNTGHDGGFCTLHANDVRSALTRLEDMIGEVTARVPRASIVTAVGAIIQIRFEGTKRVVGDIVELRGYDHAAHEYVLSPAD